MIRHWHFTALYASFCSSVCEVVLGGERGTSQGVAHMYNIPGADSTGGLLAHVLVAPTGLRCVQSTTYHVCAMLRCVFADQAVHTVPCGGQQLQQSHHSEC